MGNMVRRELLNDKQKLHFIEVLLVVGAILSALNIPVNMVWFLMLFIMAGLFIFVNIQVGIMNVHFYNVYVGLASVCFSAVFTYLFATSFVNSFSISTSILASIVIIYLFSLTYFFYIVLSKPKEGKIMLSDIRKMIKRGFTKYWYVLVIIGLLAIIFPIPLQYFGLNITLIYFAIPLGVGLISIGLACYSILVSDMSDRKMSAISNELVLRIISQYEDRRLSILRKKRELYYKMVNKTATSTEKQLFKTDFNFTVWKCVVDIQRIEVLKEFIYKKHQKRLLRWSYNLFNNILYHVRIHQVIEYLQDGSTQKRTFRLTRLSDENKNHIRTIMEFLKTLDEYQKNEELKKNIDQAYEKLRNL